MTRVMIWTWCCDIDWYEMSDMWYGSDSVLILTRDMKYVSS